MYGIKGKSKLVHTLNGECNSNYFFQAGSIKICQNGHVFTLSLGLYISLFELYIVDNQEGTLFE